MLIHPENSAMIGKVALFLDVYPEYKCETYRFRFPESENSKMKKKKKLSLAGQIFISLILAIIAGLLMQSHAEFAENYIKPFGTIFLNLLKFIVVPIVLFSIMSGIISMSDIKKVGSIGLKTVIYYFCTTAFAITFGLLFGNLFKNAFPVVATTDLSYEVTEAPSLMDTIVNIFPSNFIAPMSESNMLQVIVMALIFGFSIILIGSEKNSRLVTAINDLNEVFMKSMELILKLSPIGVFCLLCPVIAANGSNIIASLAMVLLTAYLCYVIHVVVIYSLAVKAIGGLSPLKFFKGMLPAMMFAFSSSSSVGTLPINLECVEGLGASREISSFVLPLGATINMGGAAVTISLMAMMAAHTMGIEVGFGTAVILGALSAVSACGASGVAGGSLLLIPLACSLFGIGNDVAMQVVGIGFVIGVIQDSVETAINSSTDVLFAASAEYMQWRREGRDFKPGADA